jgi:hypothetical protein
MSGDEGQPAVCSSEREGGRERLSHFVTLVHFAQDILEAFLAHPKIGDSKGAQQHGGVRQSAAPTVLSFSSIKAARHWCC